MAYAPMDAAKIKGKLHCPHCIRTMTPNNGQAWPYWYWMCNCGLLSNIV